MPPEALPNAARGIANRRTRKSPSPHAEIVIAAGGVWRHCFLAGNQRLGRLERSEVNIISS